MVYVEYRDCKNGFKESKKDFETYELAWAWVVETFDNPSKDFIYYYMVYVEYRESKKNFETYELAWAWVVETFDNPSKDFIHYYF